MSDRYLLIGTSYILSPYKFDLLSERRPKKTHISPHKYLEKLHKQGNFKPGHRKNYSYDINTSNFSIKESPKNQLKPIILDGRKENSPHFAEDISFINNKSNTYYGDESSSILETISAMKDKDLKKVVNLDGSDVKEVSEETNDKSKSQFNEEKIIKTPDVTTRKSTFKKNLTEEGNKRPQNENYDENREERRSSGKIQEENKNLQSNTVEKRKTIKNEEEIARRSIKAEENPIKNQEDLQNIERKKTLKDNQNSNEILPNTENSTRRSFKTEENMANERKRTFNNEKNIENEHILQNDLNKQPNKEQESNQIFENNPKKMSIKTVKEGNYAPAEKPIVDESSQQERKKTIKEKDETKNKEKINELRNDNTERIKKDDVETINNKSSSETTKPQIVQPKIIDRGRQRKEEFERKMKEKQSTENKLQSLKQKFQAAPQIIAEESNTTNNNINKKVPLTPKEINLPEEKKFDLEAMDRNLKQKLADLQKPEEKKEILQENLVDDKKIEAKSASENENPEKTVISLKNYRDQLKTKKNEPEKVESKPESKYVINSRGQKINKNLTGLIEMLEKTLGSGQTATTIPKIERAESNMEHLTLERSKMGHKRMKSKNTEFFEQI